MSKQSEKEQYEKPELTKHALLREVTLSSVGDDEGGKGKGKGKGSGNSESGG